MSRIFKRSYGVIPFTANTTVSLDLPRNNVFKSFYARLTLSYSKAGGTAVGVLNSEQPQSLIKSLAVIRNGSDVLQRATGGTYYALARINSDGDPQRVALATNANVGATALSVDIPIDFASWRMSNPGATMLRAVGTSSLRVDVTWGDVTDIISGSDGAPAIATVQIEIFTEELLDVTGDFGDKLIVVTEKAIAVASSQFTVDLATGPFYRRILIKAFDATLLSDAIVNRVRVISDGSFFHFDRMSWAAIQGMNKRHYSLQTLLAGYVVIDFAEDGNPAGLIDTRGASSFQLELDVSLGVGATKIQVIQEQIVPARVATAA